MQATCTDSVVRHRLAADRRRFNHTWNVYRFYLSMLRVRLHEDAGDTASAAAEAARLRKVGEALRHEDRMCAHGCEDHATLFKNGLYATYLSQPYGQVMAEYGIDVPAIEHDGVS